MHFEKKHIQIGRFLLVALPFHIATIPPDIVQLLSSFGCYMIGAQEWIHRYMCQWAILVVLLTLQSIAVTVGDTFLCQGVDGTMATWSNDLSSRACRR
jgi:hypothetical protein